MNPDHEKLCRSPEWAAHLQAQILPVVTAGVSLGQDMLEIGPGPGAATTWLQQRVAHLTVLDADEAAAARLAARYPDSNITVNIGDATQLPLGDESFDSVSSFTMLHHVPTAASAIPDPRRGTAGASAGRAAGRLGQPGQQPSCTTSTQGDTSTQPQPPTLLLVWLRALGFTAITITVGDGLMFTARKPAREASRS